MKKIKRIVLLSLLCFISLVCFTGCSKENNVIIDNVSNIEFSTAISSYDFLEGVECSEKVSVDYSDVKFGVVGEYNIVYKASKVEVSATVKIYGEPTITAKDITLSYKETNDNIVKEIEAFDSFGNKIDVYLNKIEGDVEYLKYGETYNVEYYTIDKVGNIATATRKVNVSDGQEENYGTANIDLGSSTDSFNISNGKLIGIDYGSDKLYTNYTIDESGNVGNLTELGSKLGVGTHDIKIITSENYGNLTVTVTDNLPLQYRFDYGDENSGINNYIFTKGDNMYFPQIVNKEGYYQNLNVSYKLYKNNKSVSIDSFSLDNLGEYKYVVKITGNNYEKTEKSTFYVVSEKEKLNNCFAVNSNQFINNYNPNYSADSSFEYVGKVTDNNGLTYYASKFTNNSEGVEQYKTLRFNNNILEKILSTGSTNVSFDLLLEDTNADSAYAFMFLYKQYWNCSNNFQYSVNGKEWVHVAFDLASCWVKPDVPDFYSVDYFGNYSIYYDYVGLVVRMPLGASCYVANVIFGENTNVGDEVYYNFDSGDKITISPNNMKVNKAGIENFYKINLSQNGVIKKDDTGYANNLLAWDTIADITDGILTLDDVKYYSFNYDSGKIYSSGEITLDRFGDKLEDYGCVIDYKVLKASDESEINNFDKKIMAIEIANEDGYILRLFVEKNGHKLVFDNLFYVKAENSVLNHWSCEYLRYGGFEYGRNVFEIYGGKENFKYHRTFLFDKETTNKMLDEGKTYFTVFVNTIENTGDQQVYRRTTDGVTFSGENNTLVYANDYYNVASLQYGTWAEFKINIDESMRDKEAGFSVMRNTKFYLEDILYPNS